MHPFPSVYPLGEAIRFRPIRPSVSPQAIRCPPIRYTSTMAARDPYRILGVLRDATPAQVESAYRRLAKQFHPDRNKRPDANARMADINWAYDLLSDPEQRRAYDLAHPPPPAARPRHPLGTTGLNPRRPVPRRAGGNRLGQFLSSLMDEPLTHPWIWLVLAILLAYLIYSRFPSSIDPPRNPGDLALSGAMTSAAQYFRRARQTASPLPTTLPIASVRAAPSPGDFASQCVLAITAERYVGQSVCVYGRVNRIDQGERSFSIRFIESGAGLVARSAMQSWPDLNERECIAVSGTLHAEGNERVLDIDPDGIARCP